MNGFDKTFSLVYGAFQLSVETIIPICDLLSWKTTESAGYDIVQSYEWLILSETKSWYAEEDVDDFILYQPSGGLLLLCGFDSAFEKAKGKGLIWLTT